jgi:gliding motility-associated-like protein
VQCDSVYRKTNYTIRSTPQIGLKERDTFMRGSQVTLKPFSATNYLWSTGQTTKDISFKLTEDRQLYLIAWNEEPCRDTAYISLVAEDLAIVGMPTGFSPTGEHSENRTLRPNINGRLEYFHMMVFNRWGEKVYETFDTQPQGWNGIFKGEPAPSGLYGYVMEYRTLGSIYT